MSILNDPINYKELEQELHEAMRADELYRLQNDAKIRAIEQAVPTYEDFREMVNGAHLKSLDRKDMVPKIGVKWNSIASDKNSHCNEILVTNQRKAKQISSNVVPRNAHEFRQMWKSIGDYREKFELLNNSRPTLCNVIFRSEIPPDILQDCLRACLESLNYLKTSYPVINVLITLSKSHRFQLGVAFMSDQEKIVCKQLFESLRSLCSAENDDCDVIADLEKKYTL